MGTLVLPSQDQLSHHQWQPRNAASKSCRSAAEFPKKSKKTTTNLEDWKVRGETPRILRRPQSGEEGSRGTHEQQGQAQQGQQSAVKKVAVSSRSRDLKKKRDLSNVKFERWAGPGFSNSPPPSSLPIPKFFLRKSELTDNEAATRGLRRLLNLEN